MGTPISTATGTPLSSRIGFCRPAPVKDCQNSSLLVTVLCCLTAFVSRTSSLGVWGGSFLEILSSWWLSSSRNAALPYCRYCHLARSLLVTLLIPCFSSLFAPATLFVAVSLSMTVHYSRCGCRSTFCCQHHLWEAKPASVSVFYPHCRTVPSRVVLCSVATVSAWGLSFYSRPGPSWFVSSGLSLVSL